MRPVTGQRDRPLPHGPGEADDGQHARDVDNDHEPARPERVVRTARIKSGVNAQQRDRHRRESGRGGQPEALMGSCHALKA